MTYRIAAAAVSLAVLWSVFWIAAAFHARSTRTAILYYFAAVLGGLVIIFAAAAAIGANHHG